MFALAPDLAFFAGDSLGNALARGRGDLALRDDLLGDVRTTRPYQLLEQRVVVHHGLTQVLRRGLAAGDRGVAGAVVLDDSGVLDGQMGGVLFEIGDRIAAGLHHVGDELVGLDYGPGWTVDQMRTDPQPIGPILLAH